MIPNNPDLHCHSTTSDGLLSPTAVVERALSNGVDLLSLTDHDEIGGLDEVFAAAAAEGLPCVAGVEISVSWGDDQTVHIVGLNFDHRHPALVAGLARVRSGRDARAGLMAIELAKAGIDGAYEGALKYVGNPALISRSHFARYIVERGFAPDVKTVFDHWLAKDKPGYVSHAWAGLQEAVDWIRGAGGLAVIAHPLRYRLTPTERRDLYAAFRDCGGQGIEVVSGSSSDAEIRDLARVAHDFGFRASRASDFHGPGESAIDLGRMAPLPADLHPVWAEW